MLDPVIGRWLSPDPMREFTSPYVAMGNNPMNLTDPTGGCTGDCPPEKVASIGLAGALVSEATTAGTMAGPLGVLVAAAAYGGYAMGPLVNEGFDASVDGLAGIALDLGIPADMLYPSSVLDSDGQLLPVVGDIVATHGNSKDNPNPHLVYEIYGVGANGRQTLKFGIADSKYNTYNGRGNSRPTSQLAALRAKYPHLAITYQIWSRTENRMQALFTEGAFVTNHVIKNGSLPPEQKLPLPFNFK